MKTEESRQRVGECSPNRVAGPDRGCPQPQQAPVDPSSADLKHTGTVVAAAAGDSRGPVLTDGDISLFYFKRGLLILFILGAIIRVGYFGEHARTPSYAVPTLDQKYYNTVARM